MLQVAILLLVLLFSKPSLAQYYQDGNVPAFLRDEAAQNQLGAQQQFQPQSFQGGSQPAFLQAEQEQQLQIQAQQQENTLNYQSADPNSVSYTLPPTTQENPSEQPDFLQQEKVEQAATPSTNADVATSTEPSNTAQATTEENKNPNENVIRINFSDDEYKPEEEVTEVKKEQPKENETVSQQVQEENTESTELAEGAKLTEEEQKALKEKKEAENIEKAAVEEPKKKETNIIRINYDKAKTELADNDKSALNAVIAMLKSDKNKKIRIKSYTSSDDFNNDFRRVGLQRVINIRDYLMKQGVNFSQTEVKVYGSEKNKEGLDYIDIDKI
jgi:outer membrane protein OmpA-like peptidoglycan-associated protein